MVEEGEVRGVSSYAAIAFDDSGSALLDSLLQFRASMESMNPLRKSITSSHIGGLGRSDGTSGDTSLQGSSLHAGKRLPDIEAEACIKRERAIVKGGLYQPDSGGASFVGSIHDSSHQLTANAVALRGWVDGDWPDT